MPTAEPSAWVLSRRVFLAALAATYVIAFGSLWVQIEGLFGAHGIAPIARTLEAAREVLGSSAWHEVPTVLWCSASDGMLNAVCCAGILVALCAGLGVVPRLTFALAWFLYLSLAGPGDPFLSFQWDALLLETGFLAIFLAPGGWLPYARGERPPSRALLFLVRWLLFRLMVLSGAVKLLSGDPSWLRLDALDYHYWTQPLPHRGAYVAHGLPEWTRELSVAVMFAIELGAPLLFFGTRRMKAVGAGAVAFLMVLIMATGNYGFFNVLTLALCVLLIDDRGWRKLLRRRAPENVAGPSLESPAWRRAATGVFVALVLLLTTSIGLLRLGFVRKLPRPFTWLYQQARPLGSFNAYGLFSVMTKERPEIVIEGSQDGVEWRTYRFEYKPLELERAPVFAGLHMPRLDWQLWFAALEVDRTYRSGWYAPFLARLLEGAPEVLELLREDPFDGEPPRFLRSTVYRYRFATPEEHRRGLWWERSDPVPYFPVVTLEDGELRALR